MSHNILKYNSSAVDLGRRTGQAIKELLKAVPFIDKVLVDYGSPEDSFDLIANVTIARNGWNIIVATRSTGQPRMARNAIATWEMVCKKNRLEKGYFVFAAPFISEKSQAICREANVGFFDLVGNCHLCFDHVFIERIGQTREPEKRLLRSLFYEKSARVIRRLLNDTSHAWHVHELADSTQVSTGLVSQIKTKLLDNELAQRQGDMFVLTAPNELLEQWAVSYQFRKHEQIEFYSTKPLQELDQRLAEYCNRARVDYGFTLFSGARLIGSQYLRAADRSFAYVMSDLKSIGDQLDLKQVDSGGNMVLLRPTDPDVLYAKRSIDNCTVVSDIQLFLDFSSLKGRAKETAEFIMDSRIRTTWAKQ